MIFFEKRLTNNEIISAVERDDNEAMCRSLPFEVIDDVRFASLEKIKIKNKHQIKISLDAKDYVLVELSKSSFFATRDVLKGSLERLVKNVGVKVKIG